MEHCQRAAGGLHDLRRCLPPPPNQPCARAGSDSLVDGRGQCGWYLWGALQAAAGSGREVDQSLLVRWLAGARSLLARAACRLRAGSDAGLRAPCWASWAASLACSGPWRCGRGSPSFPCRLRALCCSPPDRRRAPTADLLPRRGRLLPPGPPAQRLPALGERQGRGARCAGLPLLRPRCAAALRCRRRRRFPFPHVSTGPAPTLCCCWRPACCTRASARPPAHPPCPPTHRPRAEAEAVLTYGGACVRATFTFDRFARVARLRSRDFLRRLPSGAYEAGTLECRYSGHMLFGCAQLSCRLACLARGWPLRPLIARLAGPPASAAGRCMPPPAGCLPSRTPKPWHDVRLRPRPRPAMLGPPQAVASGAGDAGGGGHPRRRVCAHQPGGRLGAARRLPLGRRPADGGQGHGRGVRALEGCEPLLRARSCEPWAAPARLTAAKATGAVRASRFVSLGGRRGCEPLLRACAFETVPPFWRRATLPACPCTPSPPPLPAVCRCIRLGQSCPQHLSWVAQQPSPLLPCRPPWIAHPLPCVPAHRPPVHSPFGAAPCRSFILTAHTVA